MRPITDNPAGEQDVQYISELDAAGTIAYMESPLDQLTTSYEKYKAGQEGPLVNHVELNKKYPMDEKLSESMTDAQAAIMYDRFKVKRELQRNIDLAPGGFKSGFNSFAGSVIGSLVDPLGNIAAVATGGAFRAAGLVGKTLGSKIGYNIAENMIGNMAFDAAALTAGRDIGDQADFGDRMLVNVVGSTIFGVPMGALEHVFRASPDMGRKLLDTLGNRTDNGGDAKGIVTGFNTLIAAENNTVQPNYVFGPVKLDGDFYAGSMTYTENFRSSKLGSRADAGNSRGVHLSDKHTVADAAALTAESGTGGEVFTVNLKGKTILNGDTPLTAIDAPRAHEIISGIRKGIDAEERGEGAVRNFALDVDYSVSRAHSLAVAAQNNGQITMAELIEFETSIGADGYHFASDNFRGKKHDPFNSVYIFDKESLETSVNTDYLSPKETKKYFDMLPETRRSKVAEFFNLPVKGKLKELVPSAEQINSAAFISKMKGSKIVDKEGAPLVVYHGTTKKFDEFATNTGGRAESFENSQGFYFTSKLKDAVGYSGFQGDANQIARVIPVFLDLKNPVVYPAGHNASLATLTQASIERFRAAGHDGLMLDDFSEVVAFSADQIIPAHTEKIAVPFQSRPANPDVVGKLTTQQTNDLHKEINSPPKREGPKFDETRKAQGYSAVKQAELNPEKDMGAVDASFEAAKKEVETMDSFEGNLSAKDRESLTLAKLEFQRANKMEEVLNKIKGCL